MEPQAPISSRDDAARSVDLTSPDLLCVFAEDHRMSSVFASALRPPFDPTDPIAYPLLLDQRETLIVEKVRNIREMLDPDIWARSMRGCESFSARAINRVLEGIKVLELLSECKDELAAIETVSRDPLQLSNLPSIYQNNPNVVLAAVRRDGRALKHASETLRGDKEVVLAAVRQDGDALQYASETLRGDKEVVLAAVRQDCFALKHASETLRGDREFVIAIMGEGCGFMALRCASEALRNDPDLLREEKFLRRIRDDELYRDND